MVEVSSILPHPASAVFGRVLLQLAVLLGERRFVSVEADASASALSLLPNAFTALPVKLHAKNTCSALLYIQPAAALCGFLPGKNSVFKPLYPRQKQAAAKIARLVFRKNPMERGNRICSAAYINTCGPYPPEVFWLTLLFFIFRLLSSRGCRRL